MMKSHAIHCVSVGFVFAALYVQTSVAAESSEILYKQCQAKKTAVEQRECYPTVQKRAEIELIAIEKKTRANLASLENESEGSRLLHPVMAFDQAARAYRVFRSAEHQRVLTAYGSGNGGALAASQATIEMNLTRIAQLKAQ